MFEHNNGIGRGDAGFSVVTPCTWIPDSLDRNRPKIDRGEIFGRIHGSRSIDSTLDRDRGKHGL